jgi:3-deoxy-manno-octulosonate cytidylyltransferase (CMP-KDO synthetase)
LLGDPECSMSTTWESLASPADALNPDVVKVVLDDRSYATYFSRAPVPYPRDAVRRHGSIERALVNDPVLLAEFRKHTGLYVYRREFLLEFARWPQSALEQTESLEQLRAVSHGIKIKVSEACAPSIGVDTIEDLERVRAIVGKSSFAFRVSSTEFESGDSRIESIPLNSKLETQDSKLGTA